MLCDLYAIPSHNHQVYYASWRNFRSEKQGNHENIKFDDLTEMKNHFRLFDYMIDIVDEELNKDIIINMNKILKRNTSDEENPRYNVGGFKIVPNKIGLINVINTSKPEDVEKDLDELLITNKI